MSYHHISICERGKIEELNKLGYTSREIGNRIGRHHSSVSRELLRLGKSSNYNAELSEEDYKAKRKKSKPIGKWNKELSEQVKEKLKATWSPEQISHTITSDKLSFKTIYNWLYTGRIPGLTVDVLRRKGRKKTSQTAIFYARGTPIRKRPKEVYSRKTFGHWELDTVVSPRGLSGCCATFVERKTRFYTAIPMSNRTADSMESAIKFLYGSFPKGTFKTATTDRGGEFACFHAIKRDLGLSLYFADPYSPHQRGSNEYGNGLLREFYPKSSNLAMVSQQALNHNLFLINSRPRKCLNWFSPIQLFIHELAHLT